MTGQFEETKRINAVERLIARELGHILAARDAGFSINDVFISWPQGELSPIVQRDRPLDLVGAIKRFGLKTYIEKRIFVLSARAYAEYIIIVRNARRTGSKLTGSEFWDCLLRESDDIDYKKSCELATLYRSIVNGGDITGVSDSIGIEHSVLIHNYMRKFGLEPLIDLITTAEFVNLLNVIMQREVRPDGLLANTCFAIGESSVVSYLPGISDIKCQPDTEEKTLNQDESQCDSTSVENFPVEIRRLFAHELGHWLTAQILDIQANSVFVEWSGRPGTQQGSGACTMLLGNASAALDVEQYLERRIAILCAGSLADCCMRFPENKAIGDELCRTLVRGFGKDDYDKVIELILIRCVMPSWIGPTRPIIIDREPTGSATLSAAVEILRALGIWQIVRSDAYREFVYKVIEAEQKLQKWDWLLDEKVDQTIPTDRLLHYLYSQRILCILIKEAANKDLMSTESSINAVEEVSAFSAQTQ